MMMVALYRSEQRLMADCRRAARLGAAMFYHSRSLKYIACRRVGEKRSLSEHR